MLGDNIRNYRKINNLSQDELAEKLDVTRQSISLWETGQTQPSIDNIIALAKIFNISTDTLLNSETAVSSGETDEPTAVSSGDTENTIEENIFKKLKKMFNENKKPFIAVLVAVICVITVIIMLFVIFGKKSTAENEANVLPENSPMATSQGEEAVETPETQATAETIVSNITEAPKENATSAPTEKSTQAPVTTEAPKATVDLYAQLKSFVVNNGKLNGDYCCYSKYADTYGGSYDDDFALYYWGDTDTVEFTLHSVIDETYSISYYLRVPKNYTGEYEYITSYFYRSNGESVLEAKGTINASEFTLNYPLRSTKYIGSADLQNDFMETSRTGICSLIVCMKNFMQIENTGLTFYDFGFKNF